MMFLHASVCLQLQMGVSSSFPPMTWTLKDLKDSENKQEILHYGSIFSAARVYVGGLESDYLAASPIT
jgi:hypothetical protein